MSKKVSLGVAATVTLIAMAVTSHNNPSLL